MAGKRSITGLGNCNRFALTSLTHETSLHHHVEKLCLADDHTLLVHLGLGTVLYQQILSYRHERGWGCLSLKMCWHMVTTFFIWCICTPLWKLSYIFLVARALLTEYTQHVRAAHKHRVYKRPRQTASRFTNMVRVFLPQCATITHSIQSIYQAFTNFFIL